MGRSTTPKYRVEYLAAYNWRADRWVPYHMTAGGWTTKQGQGRATAGNLQKWIKGLEQSSRPGGANAHLGELQVTRARIVRQKDGVTVAEYERPLFEINSPRARKTWPLYGVAIPGGKPDKWFHTKGAAVAFRRRNPSYIVLRFDGPESVGIPVSPEGFGNVGAGYNVPAERNPPRSRRTRHNPPLVTFGNPGTRKVVAQLSKRVLEIRYIHLANNLAYKHTFARGVCAELLADGSVRLYRMDGRPLFKDFPGRSK